MNYGQIRKYDIANGPGIRTSIFVTGCHINCKNCFNKDYQNPNFGKKWTKETSYALVSYLNDPNVSGLTILGGEPFEHAVDLYKIVKEVKKQIDKSIWIYSGFTFENLLKNKDSKNLLSLVDVLVDGPFIESKKNLNLAFRGSSNQRIIDVKDSITSGKVILYNG